MDGLLELLFILAFVLWPLFGRKKKPRPTGDGRSTGQQGPPEPEPAPAGAEAEDEEWAYGADDWSTPAGAEARDAGAPADAAGRQRAGGESSEPAAEMVPDDLWSILTGQRRQPRTPPAPEPVGGPDSSGRSTPEPGGAAPQEPDYRYRAEPRSLESIPEPDYPRVVSLEQPPAPPEIRHRRFHQRLERSRPRPRGRRGSHPLAKLLRNRDRVRRAMVLNEVLGQPKGLEF